MEFVIVDWISALARWLHVIAGMAWIGSSFFFMHLDSGLKPHPDIPPGKGGAAWHVHGGGFYEMKKYLVAPASMPPDLTWHKWQSYSTWLSGFFLLGWVYYAQSALYLIDPSVRVLTPISASAIGIGSLLAGWIIYDLLCKSPLGKNETLLAAIGFCIVVGASWGYAQVFSGRGALIHTGALMATFMSGNVFRIIIPNQRKVVAALLIGEAPDPAYGKQAKQRSVHNNYLTLPVVFLMISNHYPLTQTAAIIPVFVALITFAGAIVRHFFNHWHADHTKAPYWYWAAAAVAIMLAIWLSWRAAPGYIALKGAQLQVATAPAPANTEAEAFGIIQSRCLMCHAKEPAYLGIAAPPKAVMFDTEAQMRAQAEAIMMHSVLTHAMPPNNITELSPDERQHLALWFASRTSRNN